MLCKKNGCRGTLFEYELMHNFHYFLCVLSSPPFHHPHPRAKNKDWGWKGGGGGKRARFLILFYILSFSPCLFCSGEGWKQGDGFEVPEPDLFGEDSPSTSNHLQNSQPSPAQPSRAPVMNAIPCAIRFNPSELLMFLFHLLAYSKTRFNVVFITTWGPGPLFRLGSLILALYVHDDSQPACQRTPTAARLVQYTTLLEDPPINDYPRPA